MTGLMHHEVALLLALALAICLIMLILERRSKNTTSGIQLDDLVLGDDGRVSKAAFVLGGSFLVTSWVVVFQTVNGTLSDLTFGAYVAAWVAPTVTRLIKGTPPPASSETTMTQRIVATTPEPNNGPKI